jgi:hypothetical protein
LITTDYLVPGDARHLAGQNREARNVTSYQAGEDILRVLNGQAPRNAMNGDAIQLLRSSGSALRDMVGKW